MAARMLALRALRLHRRGVLGLAVVIALAGGLSLASVAAARRTASAFTRFLEASDVSDVSVGLFPEDGGDTAVDFLAETDATLEAARHLPGVLRDSTHLGLTSMYVGGPDGRAEPDTPEPIGSLDGRYVETDRATIIEGRFADPARIDEVVVNTEAADTYGMSLGSRHELVTIAGGDEVVDVAAADVIDSTEVRVVGIGRFPEEVLRDEYDSDGLLLGTPALTARYLEYGSPYRFHALHLAPGTDISEVVSGYEKLSGEDYGLIVRRTDEQRTGAQLALRPLVVALAVFGLIAAVATLGLGGLGAVRSTLVAGSDLTALRAIGASQAALGAAAAAPAIAGTVLGVVGAAVLAVVLSPVAPVGPVREVEPDRGVNVDATAVLGGATVLLVVFVVIVGIASAVVIRRRGLVGGHTERASRFGSILAGLRLSPAATVGVRAGLGLGGVRTGAPVRSTLASCALSVVAVVATLTFGASLDGLVDHPDRYGWSADRALVAGAGYLTIPPEAVAAVEDLPDVRSVVPVSYAPVEIAGVSISGMGLDDEAGATAVTVLEGRLPANGREVALGVNTARELGVGVGERIQEPGGDLEVVGLAALPAIGLAGVSHPSLAQGAVLTPDALAARNGSAFTAVAFVDFVGGAEVAAATERARDALAGGVGVTADAVAAYDALRPAELVDVDPAKATALGLAALLAVAAVVALALTLSASVRRQRVQLAVLAAIGFDDRLLRRSVRWQAGCVLAVALVTGVPLGIAAGRLAWQAFADQIGVAPAAVVPLALVATVAGVIVLVALAATEWPARLAARTRPAVTLRPLA